MKISVIYSCLVIICVTLLFVQMLRMVSAFKEAEAIKKVELKLAKNSLELLLIGDFGDIRPYNNTEYEPLKDLAKSMTDLINQESISMIMSVGDNFYIEANTSYMFTIAKVLESYMNSSALSNIPWYLAYGNHDCYFSNYHGVYLESLYPQIYMPKGFWNLTLNFESFAVSFTFLPCDLICYGPTKSYRTEKQCNDMKAVNNKKSVYKRIARHFLSISKDPRIKWKFVVTHTPLFSVSTSGSDNESLKLYLLPLLKKYKIDAVLSGHNHNMQYLVHNSSGPTTYKRQKTDIECLKTSHFNCGEFAVLCVSRDSRCESRGLNCTNRVPMEESAEYFESSQMVFKKGQYLHQIIQGAGGSTLDPLCPALESPMAEVKFGKSIHGFSQLSLNETHFSFKFIESCNSSVLFESIIKDN